MSKLEKLIKELCPNGVEYKKLKTFCEPIKGKGLSKEDKGSGEIPIILYGELYTTYGNYISNVISCAAREKISTSTLIVYGDILMPLSSTTKEAQIGKASAFKLNTEAYLGGDALILRHSQNDSYLVHFLNSTCFEKQKMKCVKGTTINHLDYKKMLEIAIPVPPLSVQAEIVRILDNFTELTAELTAELTVRKKQYEFYRENLFTFDDSVKWKSLGEIGTFTRGRRFIHADDRDNGIPCIHYGELYTYYGIWATEVKTHINKDLKTNFRYAKMNDIVIVAAGENKVDIGVGVAWLGKYDVAIHDACFIFSHNQNPKYISYFLRTEIYHNQIFRFVSEGKICSLSADGLAKAKIPLPSLKEQQRIVDVLDQFDTLCNDISTGLPAEIEARQKQYIYYRDIIFNFK